jgi:DNA-binding GntR family transcriptional regulator
MRVLKSTEIYEDLRLEILAGRLEPGERMRLRDIAANYDSSDIPAREALWMLQRDGLVEMVPYRGARVTALSTREIQEAFFVRGKLEAIATGLAIAKMTQLDLERIEAALQRLDDVESDPLLYAELDRQFHRELIRPCDNLVLLETIEKLWQAQSAFQVLFRLDHQRVEVSRIEHRAIVREVNAGRVAVASELVFNHRISAANALANSVENEESTSST